MFERFGELGTYDDINELADNLLNEGDIESIWVLAKENGIPQDYVDGYLKGEIPILCDAMTAAIGKIEVECEELKPKEIMQDWVEYIKGCCAEDEEMARAVRREGKRLKDCVAQLLAWSFKNQIPIDKEIIKAAGIKASKVTLGIPGMGTAKQIITKYYKE